MKFFSKKELRVLWPFYMHSLLIVFFILMPFFVVYFNSIGFSLSQIGILFAIWPLSSILFEIPTGAVADLYGRKISVVVGTILTGVFIALAFFTANYYIIMLLLALSGISQTLVTGSFEAWSVDLLKGKDMEGFLKSFFSKRESLTNFGLIISGLLGVVLVKFFGLKIIWLSSGIAFVLMGVVLLFAEEKFEKKKIKLKNSLEGVFMQSKISIKFAHENKALFYIMIIAFVFSISLAIRGIIPWTPLLQGKGLSDSSFGYLWSLMGIAGVIAPILSNKILKKDKEKSFLIAMSVFILILCSSVLLLDNLFLLIGVFLLITFFINMRFPIERLYFHKFIPTEIRATMGSVRGMLIGISSVIGLTLSGILVDFLGSKYTILLGGLLMIPVIILYFKIHEKKNMMIP